MDVIECLKTRLTVRRFTDDPVPDEVVERLLRAVQWAPSSRNQQPWHLVVIRDRDTLAELGRTAQSGKFLADAPLAIAIAMENADTPWLDAGRALQQMEIAAWAEGLGTCFVGLPTAEQVGKVKELLRLPDSFELITVLPFGYRAEKNAGRGKRSRKPLSQMAHVERFGNSYGAD